MPILKHFATNTPPNIQKIKKKKENVIWENTITDFKTYCEAIVI